MSADSRENAFRPLPSSSEDAALLTEMLDQIFHPRTSFVPPPMVTSFPLGRKGVSIHEILTDVSSKVVAHAVNSRHPWAMAHMVPPPATISVLGDLLVGAMNQCAFIWEEAPLAAALEAETLAWLIRRIGFNTGAGGLLTSGGTMSNCLATYLAIARADTRQSVDRDRYCIIASDQSHFSMQKAALLTGLHASSLIRVATDSQGRLHQGQIHAATLRARASGRVPIMFVCTAGTTNSGILELPAEYLAAAQSCQAWCHVDAAHGGMMCLSEHVRSEISGWVDADSVSWDPHKSLYVSYSAGALLLRDISTRAPLDFHSEYALKDEDDNDDLDAGMGHLEGSRGLDALKLWMTIKYFGTDGYQEIIDHSLSLAQEFSAHIKSADDFTLLTEPDTNIVCFRFVDTSMSNAALDQLNTAIQKTLYRNGGPLISATRVGGRAVLRTILINPLLEAADFPSILEAIRIEAHRQISLANYDGENRREDIACY